MTDTQEQSEAAGGASDVEYVIRCRIHISDYPHKWELEPNTWEMWVVGKLKAAGVPVLGELKFCGIKSGILSWFNDPTDFDATIYEWRSNAKVPAHRTTNLNRNEIHETTARNK